MRVAVWYPSPSIAVRDTAAGYQYGLARAGAEVLPLDWPKRLGFFGRALKANGHPEPNEQEVARLATDAAVVECLRWRSDLVVLVSGMGLHGDAFRLLRRAGLPVALILTECPYQDDQMAPMAEHADWVFVNDKASLPRFRALTPRAFYLPPGHDPDIHRPILVGEEERSDVLLCGTGFGERVAFLEAVDWSGIDLRLYGLWPLAEGSPLKPFYRPTYLANDRLARLYSGAKICLNLHRTDRGWGAGGETVRDAYSINPRAYEIAGCGAFQLCDDSRPELREVFGGSVPTFSTPGQLGALLRTFLQPQMAPLRRIHAQAARERVAGHTYQARAEYLLRCVRESR